MNWRRKNWAHIRRGRLEEGGRIQLRMCMCLFELQVDVFLLSRFIFVGVYMEFI
jgi:hypothetical protein